MFIFYKPHMYANHGNICATITHRFNENMNISRATFLIGYTHVSKFFYIYSRERAQSIVTMHLNAFNISDG